MTRALSAKEEDLLALLAESLYQHEPSSAFKTKKIILQYPAADLISLADKHVVLPIIHDRLLSSVELSVSEHHHITHISRRVANQFYRLLFLTAFLVRRLLESGVQAAVLKGPIAALPYPIPETRKSGDIDLLLCNAKELGKASVILRECGFFKSKTQFGNHHVSFQNSEGIELELHLMLTEYFEDKNLNAYIVTLRQMCAKHVCEKEILGIRLPVLDAPFHASFLVLHMLQHFLRAGFGLKLLCDWATLWQQGMSDAEQGALESIMRECGLYGFAQAVTAVCVRYLALPEGKVACWHTHEVKDTALQNLIVEILEAQEFGDEHSGRMVILPNNGPGAYIRELHFQMRINHPKTSKIVLLWPALWIITLLVFLHNNRKIRGVTTKEIFASAKARQSLLTDLKLNQGTQNWE
ncbi:MAG: nucleotidyltransferase family protein [Clostridium sp.]|jgi:hypothetical protein|nr:nucleotidyltransferase family protein [Clostridium sp.]